MRAYGHARLDAKGGRRNWDVKCEIKQHIMDARHQCVCVLLQMSGVYLTAQRFVKRIGQCQIPP